jgi:hypothetical protein
MNAMKRRGWAFALPLLLTVAVTPLRHAHAAGPCYPRDAIYAHLAERYGERPAGVGVAAGQLVELLVRPDGASWTILVIRPDGLACPVAAGEDWRDVNEPASNHGDGSS